MDNSQQLMELMKKPVPRKRVGIIRTQIVKKGSLLYGKRRFQSSEEAVGLVKGLFEYADREMVVVVSLDAKNTPLAIEIVSVGTVNTCLVQMREIFKHAILDNAVQVICFHNHRRKGMLTD
jgi:DNA repair proteins